jgi:hypothetical protein
VRFVADRRSRWVRARFVSLTIHVSY